MKVWNKTIKMLLLVTFVFEGSFGSGVGISLKNPREIASKLDAVEASRCSIEISTFFDKQKDGKIDEEDFGFLKGAWINGNFTKLALSLCETTDGYIEGERGELEKLVKWYLEKGRKAGKRNRNVAIAALLFSCNDGGKEVFYYKKLPFLFISGCDTDLLKGADGAEKFQENYLKNCKNCSVKMDGKQAQTYAHSERAILAYFFKNLNEITKTVNEGNLSDICLLIRNYNNPMCDNCKSCFLPGKGGAFKVEQEGKNIVFISKGGEADRDYVDGGKEEVTVRILDSICPKLSVFGFCTTPDESYSEEIKFLPGK